MGKLVYFLSILCLVIILSACSDEDPAATTNDGPVTRVKISANGGTESHTDSRRGRNCMDCHYSGNNPYVYQLAGTVYQNGDNTIPYPNATVNIRTGPGPTDDLVVSIEVDANGNFFTTQTFDLSGGVYASVEGNAGETPMHMGNFITHGQCNRCHGSTTAPITVGIVSVVPVELSSQNGSVISHTDQRRGQNCMNCHYEGNNPIVYQVAGTAYDVNDNTLPYPNGAINLRSGPGIQDPLLATVEIDANGNFYTTDLIDFSNGVYPSVIGTSGEEPLHMSNFTISGECNSCHGTATLPIYAGTVEVPPIQRISQNGLTLSHTDQRRGQDCTQCHSEYTIAGTVYDFDLQNYYADAKLYFYTEANAGGTLVTTLEVDANGNYYTTESVDFSNGLYPVLENAAGDYRNYMLSSINTGACSSCHGVSTLPVHIGEIVNTLISQRGGTSSHTDQRRGQDCLSCHSPGNNAYVYTLAGTVYQLDNPNEIFPNATLKLYSKEGRKKGDLVVTLDVDANGNFYTTETIDFGTGLYPTIESGGVEQPLDMPASTANGSCNSCHNGVGINRILAAGPPVQTVSLHNTTFSHTDGRRGVDCLGCHNIGGNNRYQYSVAGTVYNINLIDFYPNATVSIYSGSGKSGDLLATIEVDANGNFYTTEAIEIGKGKKAIYASIVGNQPTSPSIEMQAETDNGACSNSGCHGVTRPPIYAVD